MEKKEIKPYSRMVQYYETDGMRIVHHSNYIRYMEEARMDFLAQTGYPYDELERRGIMFPVLSASCEYKQYLTFGDIFYVHTRLEWFDGIRYAVTYRITDASGGILHATGETQHCFLSTDLKPMMVKRKDPEVFAGFCLYANELRGTLKKLRG